MRPLLERAEAPADPPFWPTTMLYELSASMIIFALASSNIDLELQLVETNYTNNVGKKMWAY